MRALVKLDESIGYELKENYPISNPVRDEAQIKVKKNFFEIFSPKILTVFCR